MYPATKPAVACPVATSRTRSVAMIFGTVVVAAIIVVVPLKESSSAISRSDAEHVARMLLLVTLTTAARNACAKKTSAMSVDDFSASYDPAMVQFLRMKTCSGLFTAAPKSAMRATARAPVADVPSCKSTWLLMTEMDSTESTVPRTWSTLDPANCVAV